MKKNREKRFIFAANPNTLGMEIYNKDESGNIIDSDFNNKTFIKKAYKSYLKGKTHFNYKGINFAVPLVDMESINLLTEEELSSLDNVDLLNEE